MFLIQSRLRKQAWIVFSLLFMFLIQSRLRKQAWRIRKKLQPLLSLSLSLFSFSEKYFFFFLIGNSKKQKINLSEKRKINPYSTHKQAFGSLLLSRIVIKKMLYKTL